MAFPGQFPSLSKGGENAKGMGGTKHQLLTQSFTNTLLSFCSVPDPGTGNAETNMELTEQGASEERHDSSIPSVQNARKERPGCLTELRHSHPTMQRAEYR